MKKLELKFNDLVTGVKDIFGKDHERIVNIVCGEKTHDYLIPLILEFNKPEIPCVLTHKSFYDALIDWELRF